MEAGVEAYRNYLKKFAEEAVKHLVIDSKMFENIRKAEKAESRRGKSATVGEQYMAEAALKGELVKQNIMMRAELREKKASQFPNIAGLLAGQAPGPIGMMGKMQRQMSVPFRAVHEYKQKKDELDKWEKSHFIPTKEEREDRGRMVKDLEGSKKRAQSGFGRNIMGKRMQSMIGKVGKFMDSSKGQGMMAGGMMGASILTMVIKKAMEASPMLQQMLKIMNVAMTLFLRPIGDFIGGMLKPIMLFFLREIAVPMLKKGKDFIKFGEAFGKNVLGFLLKPIETIQAAILGVFPFVGEDLRALALRFDGIKEWMTEQKMNMIATDMGYSNRQDLIDDVNKAKNMGTHDKGGPGKGAPGDSQFDVAAWAALEAEFGTGWVPTLAESLQGVISPLDTFRQLMTDASQNTYTYVTAQMELEGAGIAVAEGMGAITGQFTLVSEATGKVVKAMEDLENQLTGGGTSTDGTGTTTTTTTEDGTGTTTTGPMQGPPEAPTPVDYLKQAHWSDISVYKTL